MTLVTVVAACALAACSTLSPTPRSLYERLGGRAMIDTIATQLVAGFARSADGHRAFDRVRLVRVQRQLGEFLCVVADGPCTYDGDDMRLVHAGHAITEREFDALVEQLRTTLDALDIDTGAKNELLRRLAPMRRDIVTAGLAPRQARG